MALLRLCSPITYSLRRCVCVCVCTLLYSVSMCSLVHHSECPCWAGFALSCAGFCNHSFAQFRRICVRLDSCAVPHPLCQIDVVIGVFHLAAFIFLILPSIITFNHSDKFIAFIVFGAGKKKNNAFFFFLPRRVLLWQFWQSDWACERFANYLSVIWLGEWLICGQLNHWLVSRHGDRLIDSLSWQDDWLDAVWLPICGSHWLTE